MANHLLLFTGWTSEQLQSLAEVLDSAEGEGAGDDELADALRDEALRRDIVLPLAYGHGEYDPLTWRQGMLFIRGGAQPGSGRPRNDTYPD